MCRSHPDYAEKMKGKLHIELQVELCDGVQVGIGSPWGHVQLPAPASPLSLLDIKRVLKDSHGVDWALDSQTTCRFNPPPPLPHNDDNSVIVAAGLHVTLLPPARLWVQRFPPILIQPYTASAAVASASSKIGLTVVISSAGAADYELVVQPCANCSVGMLKMLLQQEHDVEWAVASSRCVTETSKPMKDHEIVAVTGRVKLRKT
jgi:hypothetical protein